MDPSLFSPAAVDPETAAYNKELERVLAQYPRIETLPPPVVRKAREEGRSAFGPLVISDRATEGSIRTNLGPLRTRSFLPEQINGVYLHIHGGGWTIGGVHYQDPRLELLSSRCSLAVLSVDYRLSPENPYPAAPDDCEAAALWLIDNAQEEFGTNRLLIGGESAGAHLAAVTLLRLRDRHRLRPFAGANLVYGAFDLRITPSARNWGDRLLVLNTPIIEFFTDNFVPEVRRSEADVSPLLADLASLPPALFTVGTEDPLLDDTLFMYDRWVASGNAAELAIYPGGAHGFDAFPIALATIALDRMHAFLNKC